MRTIELGVAQLGPIQRADSRESVVRRLLALLDRAHARGCSLVVFPELALTTFFPRWYFDDPAQLDAFYEAEMPNEVTRPLFEAARDYGIGFYLGFAEKTTDADGVVHHYNTSLLVERDGSIVGRYRKVHLPGHTEHEPWRVFQHLEKRYFEPGQEGFGVWQAFGGMVGMCLCNDRRWPETYRVMGLKGAELIMLGYNTPVQYMPVPQHDHLQSFHHLLSMQAGAYQNGAWVAAAGKAGLEEGCMLLGHSCIIAPTGEIVAMSSTLGDELITASCDLDRCAEIRDNVFNFALHRQPQHYGIITEPHIRPRIAMKLLSSHPLEHRHNAAARFDNPFGPRQDAVLGEADCAAARAEISAWPGYAVTPLHELSGLASAAGLGRVWFKDEAGRFGLGSFKALGGAYAVSRILIAAIRERTGDSASTADLLSGRYKDIVAGVTVTCATDGNHGRSVAWGAQRFGCPCVIYIHATVSEGRKAAIERFGATVVRTAGNYDDSVRQAAEDAARLGRIVVSDTSYPGYMDIPRFVMQGYTVLADEAIEQLPADAMPSHVFLQGGVGGFAAAVMARFWQRFGAARPRFVIVEPDRAACILESVAKGEPTVVHGDLDTLMAGLACGEVSLLAWEILEPAADDALAIPDAAAVECMKLLAQGVAEDPPLVSGESGVTGLAGALVALQHPDVARALGLDANSRVLVISTEGATDPVLYRELVGRSAQEVTA